jgi:hypothetical protein
MPKMSGMNKPTYTELSLEALYDLLVPAVEQLVVELDHKGIEDNSLSGKKKQVETLLKVITAKRPKGKTMRQAIEDNERGKTNGSQE